MTTFQNKAAVSINGRIEVVFPDTKIVTKNGNQQFWFTLGRRKLLAIKPSNSGTFKVN